MTGALNIAQVDSVANLQALQATEKAPAPQSKAAKILGTDVSVGNASDAPSGPSQLAARNTKPIESPFSNLLQVDSQTAYDPVSFFRLTPDQINDIRQLAANNISYDVIA